MHATIDDAIDRAGLPLLGVVPEDDALPLCVNQGLPLLLAESQSAAIRLSQYRQTPPGGTGPPAADQIEKGASHEYRPHVP